MIYNSFFETISKKKYEINLIMVKKILVKKYISDKIMEKKEGEYFTKKDFNLIIKSDADVYYIDDDGKKKILLKFRKKIVPKKLSIDAFNAFNKASKKKHNNRGAAAGKLDFSKLPNYVGSLVDTNKGGFRTKFIGKFTKKKHKQLISNYSPSNIIGYYDKPDRNKKGKGIPCRKTVFTEKEIKKWKKGLPYIKYMDKCFKNLNPIEYTNQIKEAKKSKFHVKGTSFSTATINNNWQTALHKDDGDYKDGFGNLCVIERGNYEGGYTGFPQFKVAVDVRTGDYLSMDVHNWHCNTPLYGNNFDRLSIVAYLRSGMSECPKKIREFKIRQNRFGGKRKVKKKKTLKKNKSGN